MTRRSGATLVEVLVTIFVMALGLIALLTLFPIGALRMAEAIKDSRTALAAANAEALATARNLRNDGRVTPHYAANLATQLADGPSYPVYMDPIGFRIYSGQPLYADWVSGVNAPLGIRRVSAEYIHAQVGQQPPLPPRPPTVPEMIQRMLPSFSLLDDITFGPDGVPIDPMGNPTGPNNNNVQREGRYSWGLMFKRPKTSIPSVVDMTVVVYSGRPLQLASGIGGPIGETYYETRDGTEGQNKLTVVIGAGQERPNIKKGSWILDSTAYNLANSSLPPLYRRLALQHGPVHGAFYRVAGVVRESGNEMELQLETPLKAGIGTRVPNVYEPRIVVMEYVAEVFEKGTGWLP